MLKNILSINWNHDGAGAIIIEGQIAGYVNTERYSRLKKHPGLRGEDLTELLAQAQLKMEDIDLVMMVNLGGNYPEVEARYGSDLRETWLDFSLNEEKDQVRIRGRRIPCVTNPYHSLCHNALAYYFSPFSSAVCLAYDPMESGICYGHGSSLHTLDFPPTEAGKVYDFVSNAFLGFGGVFGAGKTMGLAPYGRPDIPEAGHDKGAAVAEPIRALAVAAAQYCTPEVSKQALDLIEELADKHPTMIDAGGKQVNAAQAFLVQDFLERQMVFYLRSVHRFILGRYRSEAFARNLCLGGGTALNSVANQVGFVESPFEEIYLHPACGDDGTAIGAALYHWHHVLGNPRIEHTNIQAMYSIRAYGQQHIQAALERHRSEVTVSRPDDYISEAAHLIAQGKIIGWYQGAGEIGPRALGNRSILCDPRDGAMKQTLNARVKFREAFRPFAPTVLDTYSEEWFGLKDSPFMLRVAEVLQEGAPAITHHDGTARPQVLRREDNRPYYSLIEAFHGLTGVPLVLNTSFNIRGEPMVETPEDALRCFLETGLQHLIFPGLVVSKSGSAR